MEYQQFAIYYQWNNEDRARRSMRRRGDDEAIQRGLREAAQRRRQATRGAWVAAFERALAALRLIRRAPRIVV